ncbi:uncharacterized protein LOC118566456 [Fundulus heteroclitus]|uniref:uncharacterized protein LOC118566456 n=1 Tax=Fundulus heteroclitus TaxID=8078 RepID=UPI00165AF86B|nr:uncharacterized protein LOC118566456 [Fundulus heteroclitus]
MSLRSSQSTPAPCALRPNPHHPPRTIMDVRSNGSWPPVDEVRGSSISSTGWAAVPRIGPGSRAPPSRTAHSLTRFSPLVRLRPPLGRQVATLEGGVVSGLSWQGHAACCHLCFVHRCSRLAGGRSRRTCSSSAAPELHYKICTRTAGGCLSVTVVVPPRAPSSSFELLSPTRAASWDFPVHLEWSLASRTRRTPDDSQVPSAVLNPPVLLGPLAPLSAARTPTTNIQLSPHCRPPRSGFLHLVIDLVPAARVPARVSSCPQISFAD